MTPFLVAEVRPQVNGIVKRRLFTEGGLVKAGQPLYQLDDATYRADAESAKAALARAEATLATDAAQRAPQRGTGQDRCGQQAGRRKRRRRAARRPRPTSRRREPPSQRADVDPRLRAHHLAHQRAHRQVVGDPGRARHREPGRARSPRCSSSIRCTSTSRNRAPSCSNCAGHSPRAASSGARDLPVRILLEDGTPLRSGPASSRSRTSPSIRPRAASRCAWWCPIRRTCCCPACTSARVVGSGERDERAARAATGHRARSEGRRHGDGRRRGRQGRGAAGAGQPRDRRQVAGRRRPRGGRPGDRRRPAEDPARRARAGHGGRCAPAPAAQPAPRRRSSRPGDTACHASSSTGRSSPGSSRSSSCSRAASRSRSCRLACTRTSRRPRSRSTPTIPGASAQVVEDSVTQIIEQNMKGLDGLHLHVVDQRGQRPAPRSRSRSRAAPIPTSRRCRCRTSCSWRCRCCRRSCSGRASTSASRAAGFLMVVGFVSEDGSMSRDDIADYVDRQPRRPARARPGRRQRAGVRRAVRDAHLARPGQARDLRPDHRRRHRRGAGAERAGHGRAARRHAGRPRASSSMPTITAQERLQTPEQFRDIVLRSNPDGSIAAARRRRPRRARRRELRVHQPLQRPAGERHRRSRSRPAPTRCRRRRAVEEALDELQPFFPPGLKAVVPFDTTPFVRVSIQGVVDDAGRGDRARVPGDVPVPAELPRDADPDDRGAGGAARHVRRAGGARLLDQHADDVRDGAGHRPAGRRRDRRRRERRAR